MVWERMLVLTTHHRDTGAVLSHWVMSRIQVLYLVAQSCLTLCYPLDCSPPGSSVHGDSPGKNTDWSVFPCPPQGIFPTQWLNPGLSHCPQILYQLSNQGSPRILEWVAYPFSRGYSQPRNQTGVSCIASGFFTIWATREVQGIQGKGLIYGALCWHINSNT